MLTIAIRYLHCNGSDEPEQAIATSKPAFDIEQTFDNLYFNN